MYLAQPALGLGSTVKSFLLAIQRDVFKDSEIPSTAKWEAEPSGQHLELGIAEMNLFIALAAAGLSELSFWEALTTDRYPL